MIINTRSEDETRKVGNSIGQQLKGGQVLELVGDVGSGKTTLVKGIAEGLGVKSIVSSPSFTICQQYTCRDNLLLMHYDFYRLKDAGIMLNELAGLAGDVNTVVVIEWGGIVEGVLPDDKITIKLDLVSEEARVITILGNLELSL